MHDIERHIAGIYLTAAEVRFLCSVDCIVLILSELRLLPSNKQILELAAIAEKKNRRDIWRTCFSGKRAELFLCQYAVLDGFADALEIPTEVMNVLELPASLFVEAL